MQPSKVSASNSEGIIQSYWAMLQLLWPMAGLNSVSERFSISFYHFTLGNTPLTQKMSTIKTVDNASRQNIRRNQVLRSFISWKNRTLKLVRMSVKSDSQLQEAIVGDNSELTRRACVGQTLPPRQESHYRSRLLLSSHCIRRALTK
jgi:hypothetical protein